MGQGRNQVFQCKNLESNQCFARKVVPVSRQKSLIESQKCLELLAYYKRKELRNVRYRFFDMFPKIKDLENCKDSDSVIQTTEWQHGLPLNVYMKRHHAHWSFHGIIHAIVKPIFIRMIHMHKAGVIHCDIKPQNIIVSPDELDATLIDFDLSFRIQPLSPRCKEYDDNPNNAIMCWDGKCDHMVCLKKRGTPHFLSHEMVQRKCHMDISNLPILDYHSFGVTLYYIFAKRKLPFDTSSSSSSSSSESNSDSNNHEEEKEEENEKRKNLMKNIRHNKWNRNHLKMALRLNDTRKYKGFDYAQRTYLYSIIGGLLERDFDTKKQAILNLYTLINARGGNWSPPHQPSLSSLSEIVQQQFPWMHPKRSCSSSDDKQKRDESSKNRLKISYHITERRCDQENDPLASGYHSHYYRRNSQSCI